MRSPSVLLAAALLSTTAHAVAPGELVPPSTVATPFAHVQHPEIQGAMASQPKWLDFRQAHPGWSATFDERTGQARRMIGPGLHLGDTSTEAATTQAAWNFVETWPEALDLLGADLELASVHLEEATNTWYVDFDVYREGILLEGGRVHLRIKNGNLVMVNAQTYPGMTIATPPKTLGPSAMSALAAPAFKGHQLLQADTRLLPVRTDAGWELRPAWQMDTQVGDSLETWSSWVDAYTGEILASGSHVLHFEGTVMAKHDQRLLGDGLATSPLRGARISNGNTTVFTDDLGNFSIPDSANGTYTVSLDGEAFQTINRTGDIEGVYTPDGEGVITVTPSDGAPKMVGAHAALTAYHHAYIVRDWWAARADGTADNPFPGVDVQITVNIEDECNAFYVNRTINFFQSSSSCANTGRLADVVYHEWGHGFHQHALVGTARYDGSLGEGAADVVSMLITNDHSLAPDFNNFGNAPLRDLENDHEYPADYAEGEDFIHANGTIFGGAMWDFKVLLEEGGMSTADAIDTVATILENGLKGGPTIENSWFEMVAADDDNGDLTDGTPHFEELTEAFGKHGLGPDAGQGLTMIHAPVTTLEPGEVFTVSAELDNPFAAVYPIAIDYGRVHYRVNSGYWDDVAMTIDGDLAEVDLPAFAHGDVVEYYIEMSNTQGTRFNAPLNGDIRPYTFTVGEMLEIVCEDFESTSGNFSVEGLVNPGNIDWSRGTPIGAFGGPISAFSGSNIWATNLTDSYRFGQALLHTPEYDLRHFQDIVLSYERFLSVDNRNVDEATIYANSKAVWRNYGGGDGRAHEDTEWSKHNISLRAYDDRGFMKISWELNAQGRRSTNYTGWHIDDFCLLAPATPNNRLGISGIAVDRNGDKRGRLSFTAPIDENATTIRVVRKKGAWPEGPEDGDVAGELTGFSPNENMTFIDERSKGKGNLYYAVYATDGVDWSTATRVDHNAAVLDPGVGCSSTGASPISWMWLGLIPLGWARRRND